MATREEAVLCSRRACLAALTPESAWRRFCGSPLQGGDPYCAGCARVINRGAGERIVEPSNALATGEGKEG